MGFKSRRQVKSKTKAPSRDRDEPFDKIHKTLKDYKKTGDPVFSMDSKRKESLGEIHRSGAVIANQAVEVLDHDLPAYNDGEVTPHGIYDVQENTRHVQGNRTSILFLTVRKSDALPTRSTIGLQTSRPSREQP